VRCCSAAFISYNLLGWFRRNPKMYGKIYTIQKAIAALVSLLDTMGMNMKVYGMLPNAVTPMPRKAMEYASGLLETMAEDITEVVDWAKKAEKNGVFKVFLKYAGYKIIDGCILECEEGYGIEEHGYDDYEVSMMTSAATKARAEVYAIHRQVRSLKRDLKTVSRLTGIPMDDVTGYELIGFKD
jgi:hypothetical protein